MRTASVLVLTTLLVASTAEARLVKRYRARQPNALTGAMGFAVDLNAFTPGGFKWFNEYDHHLGGPTWINLQLNVTAGEGGRCHWQTGDVWVCDRWRGSGLELGLGVKLKWRPGRSPLQLQVKLGPAAELVWFDAFHGTALALRSGLGVRYFVVPSLSVGAEVAAAVGPLFSRYDDGARLYSAVDLGFGVEWRF
jgi:hypothetical protein